MKKHFSFLLAAVVIIATVPSVALAVWWNPFTWFKPKVQDKVWEIPPALDSRIVLSSDDAVLPIAPEQITVTEKTEAVPVQPRVVMNTAQCLKQNGVLFYGASWCPHCAQQKALFKTTYTDLPYVECSAPDGNGQTEECKAQKVMAYPTWRFPDGSELTGVIPVEKLASIIGCPVSFEISTEK